MSAIDTENAKQIRAPMALSCGIVAKADINLTLSGLSGWAIEDTNPSVSIEAMEWPVTEIADLQGIGFPVDGTREFYTAGAGSEGGKVGLRTHIGGTGTVTVSASSTITALTIYTEGEGTITADGTTYEARGVNVIPVNATSKTLSFTAGNADERIEVHTITAGVNLSWDNDTILSVELDLRSDLSIDNAQWAVSEIEIKAYYPDDISEAVSGISDNVPMWYSAGYAGDMSAERRFFVSEPVTMENNIITIRGHDASYRLAEKNFAAQILNTTSGTGFYELYLKLMHIIQDAGITLRSRGAAPAKTSGTTERSLIFKAATADKLVADIMNLGHTGTFWPTFVDAGIPVLRHIKPTAERWTIREEDCGEVKRSVDRNIARIRSRDDYGLHSRIVRSADWKELFRLKVEAGARYMRNAGGYYWALTVSNATDVISTAESIHWTAERATTSRGISRYGIDKNGNVIEEKETVYIDESVIKGKSAAITKLADSVTANPQRAGIIMEVSPTAYGQIFAEGVFLYPNYNYLFRRSNITGSFVWKGDPRMQPRDVFKFVRLDGTEELCTIETIVLRHEGGGTSAEISYRLGVC